MFVLQKDDGKLLLVPEHQKPGSPAQFVLLLLVEWSHKKSASWQSINSCVAMTQVNAASEWFSILRDHCFHESPAAQENCSPNLMQYAFLWCHMCMNTHVAKMGVCAHIPTLHICVFSFICKWFATVLYWKISMLAQPPCRRVWNVRAEIRATW